MKKYYEEKIEYIYDRFKELFIEMLKKKNCPNIDEFIFFSTYAFYTKKYYPELVSKINRVMYYYTEEKDSEEKLEYLMRLYKNIKEIVYGK